MLTRREWLLGTVGIVALPCVLRAQEHADAAVKAVADGRMVAFEYLTPDAARTLSALAAEIIPSDDGPGATEAGAVYFIDRALVTFDQEKREPYSRAFARSMRCAARCSQPRRALRHSAASSGAS